MRKIIEKTTRIAALALALAFGLTATGWAATSLEETGGYAADASLIVFKNATLAELTATTLSARFGGDWSGTAKTLKMTFNNFDRSAEASGTITCEAQVQHDDAVKGLLLTFTQVGDDVAVKTTGAKYKTGTVGESIASANDATGHYAIYNFALPRTPETSATIVWESGEFEMTKVGSDGNAYSFSSFGGLSVNGDGNLVVDTANAQGAIIELPDTSKTAVSVLIKYSNLATETGGNATLANCAINSGNTTHYLGARTSTKGTLPLTAYYAGNAYAFNDATYGRGNVPSMDTGSGYFLFAHGSSNGTYAYSGETIGALDGGYNTQLKWGGYTITKVSIGGGFENNRAYCWKGSGTVIEKVAIFLGSIKTPSDLADYYFPSAVAKDYEKWEYAKAMLTRAGSGELAAGTYKLFDAHSGLNTDTNYNGNTSNYSLFGYTGSGVRFWKYLCYASLDDPVGWQAPGLALRFSASETSANKTIGGTFGPVQFAGLYVESGATGYSFTQTGSKRDTILGDPSGGSAETWFVFDEPFAVQRNGTMWFAGTVNLTLTESTDVLTLNTSASDGSNDCAPHIVESITKQGNGVQVTTSATTAGGTLKMHGAGYLTATKLTATGATLDFSDIGSRYNAATPFINCPLVIDGDTKFVFPEGIVLPYTYKVATSITANGTPASEYTDANGNVFTVPLAIDTANGTVTVSDDLMTASKIVVNGALTISAATAADIVVNSTGALTLATGGSLSGTVTGSGTVVCSQGVDLSGGGFDNASGWTGKVQLTGDATIPTTYYDESAYGNANSSLEVVSGHAALTAATSLPGTVNVASGSTLYITSASLTSLAISGTNSGIINLQMAANLATLTLSDGIARGTVVYPNSLTTLNVSLTETVADDGVKSFTCGSATPTSGTLTLTRADGAAAEPISGTISGSTVSFAWTPSVSGAACWCAYEFETSGSTALKNTGSDTTGLSADGSFSAAASVDGNGRLYTYSHPWRNITYPADGNWSAMVRCTVPKLAEALVVAFGTKAAGMIGLAAGATPDTEMRVVQGISTDKDHYLTNGVMSVVNGTTAQHVYVFTVEGNQHVKVYCDGSLINSVDFESQFTIGGGIQVGTVHGGLAYGLHACRSDTNPDAAYAELSEEDQKAARVDSMRLYKATLGPNAIAQLSTEFPAVKLFEATIDGGNDNEWATLGWTGGDISTLNAYSTIRLTVTDDATLTLPSSITADEFYINVTSGKTLTLNQGSGVTLDLIHPMEVNGGAIAFTATDIKLGSSVNIGGTGTVKLGNGTIINETLSGTVKVEIASGDTVAVVSGGSIANPLTGAGTLTYMYTTVPTSALSFSSWTGTVQLPAIASGEIIFNNYGTTGSTVYLTSMSSSAWIDPSYTTINPKLYLAGNMTLAAMSTRTYTFAEIDGPGALSFATGAGEPTVNITKVAEGYSGTISSTLGNPVTIATLDRAAGTTVTPGSKVLSTSSGVQASVLTVGGEATGIVPVFDTDGLYVKAASVTKNDATTNYDTLSAATTALGSDAGTLTLLMSTDSAITLAPGQTLVNGNLTTGSVTGPNGYELVNNNGTYTLVDNTASTWAPGDGSDNSWNTGANWSTGYKPNAYTAVTFPSGTHTVSITGYSDSAEETAKCASMQLVGDVTFQRGGSDWTYLLLGGNITGSGTMTLEQVGIKSTNNVTIECPVVGNATANDNFFSTGTFTFNNTVNVAAGEFKAEYADLVFGALVTLANGGYVKANGSGSTATFNEGISVPENAAASLTVGSGTHTIASTVTLASGATLTVPTASTTVSGATFETSVADSYVKATAGESTTVYSVAAKTAVTVSVGSNVSLTINGNAVADGNTLKFAPGETFTYAATPAANYTAAVAVTGGTDNNGTVTVGETAIAVAATATRNGITVSGVSFEYGSDYATADVTATVSDPAATYKMTVDNNEYTGVVSGSTVTFSNVATGHASAYDSVSYTITATDGESDVPVTSGGSGSAVVADSDKWVDENSGTTGTAAAGGSWTTEVTYDNNVAAVSDNTFTAVNCSTGDLVTVTIENVVYEALSDLDVSAIAADSQGAFCLGAVEANDVVTTNFMILAKEDSAFVWKPAAWSGTPALNTEYDVEFSFDYAHGKYSVKINGTALSVNNATAFDLCTSKTEVKAVDFKGSGKLSSILGVESTGYMVKDSAGNWYATIADAITAYDAANGPYFVLRAGTAPAGWKIVTVDGVSILKKDVSGVLILTF